MENESGMGWKINDPKEREKCKDKSAELFRKCVEAQAFAANESIKTSKSSKYFTDTTSSLTKSVLCLSMAVNLRTGKIMEKISLDRARQLRFC